MARVKIELWMWFGKVLGGDFQSPSQMRSILETDVEEGMAVKVLFDRLAESYPPVGEKVFNRTAKGFYPNVVVLFNDQVISLNELHEKILKEGDHLKIVPLYVGG